MKFVRRQQEEQMEKIMEIVAIAKKKVAGKNKEKKEK